MSGKNWAIAIGINHYTNLPTLKFADRDAVAVGEFLQAELAATVIRFAADRPPPPPEEGNFSTLPTFGELRNFLRRRFEQPFLQPGDNLWFFFAGHGLQWSGRDYLLASDSDPGDPEATALHVGWVVDRLRRSGADNVLLFIDACRNAEGGRDGSRGIGSETQKGVVTIFGCSPQQKSYELDELEQGAFTYALLEGLRLQGAGNCATVDRLQKYLLDRVPSLTAAKSGRQVPYACIEPASKLHLILLPRCATINDTTPLRHEALRADRDGRYAEARALWLRVLAVSPVDLEAIREIERLALRGGDQLPPQPHDPRGDRAAGQWGQWPASRRRVLQWLGYSGAGLAGSGLVYALTRPSQPVPGVASPSPVPSAKPTATVPTPVPSPSHTAASTPAPAKTSPTPPGTTVSFAVVKLKDNGDIDPATSRVESALIFDDANNSVRNLGFQLPIVQIPGGKFLMGSPDNEAQRESDEGLQQEVIVPEFYMARYPVTQAQWRAVAAMKQERIPLDPNPVDQLEFKGDNRPVINVSWHQSMEFCARLSKATQRNYRLPTEAEWEYACRARTLTPFHFGPTITTNVANYRGTDWKIGDTTYLGNYGNGLKGEDRQRTTDVGFFKHNGQEIANAFGLVDMHGNVWEWCLDWYENNYQIKREQAKGLVKNNNLSQVLFKEKRAQFLLSGDEMMQHWKSGKFDNDNSDRVFRGGSWVNVPGGCRSANRLRYDASGTGFDAGLRPVLSPLRS